jgi:hypothetical protein
MPVQASDLHLPYFTAAAKDHNNCLVVTDSWSLTLHPRTVSTRTVRTRAADSAVLVKVIRKT